MQVVEQVRMDKWLWAVRLYKTRSIAASACAGGKVRIGGQPVKPARSVRPGEIVTATTGEITRTIRVVNLIERRVAAPQATGCYEDLTPASEYEKPRLPDFRPIAIRPKGTGRPTKKERRETDQLRG
jgi:ribosome-associated heat shock protein Hsp15